MSVLCSVYSALSSVGNSVSVVAFFLQSSVIYVTADIIFWNSTCTLSHNLHCEHVFTQLSSSVRFYYE